MSESLFQAPEDRMLDLRPSLITRYLRVNGWTQETETSGIKSIWTKSNVGSRILIPLDPDFNDYRERLAEAFAAMSRASEMSLAALGRRIESAGSDVMFLRAQQVSADGSIPIREAENLLLSARKMLTAAALSAVSPKANFGPARPAAVKDFIDDDVRMGHTLHGSFVITIMTRLDDEDASDVQLHNSGAAVSNAPADAPELSFQRRAMTTLATGLNFASELLQNNPVDLDAAVEMGLSAQLIDSLANISDLEGVQTLQSSFEWAAGHAKVSDDIPRLIEFPRVTKEQVASVTKRLKRRPDLDFDQVIGPVVRLERDEDDATGVAVVDGYVGNDRKRVRVELAPKAYGIATTAHDQREPVIVRGAITFDRGSYRISSPTRFEIIGSSMNGGSSS